MYNMNDLSVITFNKIYLNYFYSLWLKINNNVPTINILNIFITYLLNTYYSFTFIKVFNPISRITKFCYNNVH